MISGNWLTNCGRNSEMTAVLWACSYVHGNSSVNCTCIIKGSTWTSVWEQQCCCPGGGNNRAACSPSPSLRPWKDHSTPLHCICFRHGIWELPSSICPSVPLFVQATSCPLGASVLSFQRLGNIPVYRYAALSPSVHWLTGWSRILAVMRNYKHSWRSSF